MSECQDCGAPMTPGIVSKGWCSAECDLKTNPGLALSGDPVYYTGTAYTGIHTVTGAQVVYFKCPVMDIMDIPVHIIGGEVEDLDRLRVGVSGSWEAVPAETHPDLFDF